MIETIDEVKLEERSRGANSSSDSSNSFRYTSSPLRSKAPTRQPAVANEAKSIYKNNSKDASAFESSSSTLGAHGSAQQKSPSEMMPPASQNKAATVDNFMNFFSKEVFQIVLHNPTTSHRFMKFCQSRACAENIEFLQKIDTYNRHLDEVTKLLAEIHNTYTSVEAPRQINVSYPSIKRITSDIKATTQSTIPAMESIFAGAQEQVEKLLATDMYPRFVKHQITTSATLALADNESRFQGLGDCFCLTDPSIADNPILYASDGFVEVTGYSRRDIIPRNCRFLQGPSTDRQSVKRLRSSIDSCEETVELLLNYRKNGDPFWNLLYVSPLLDEEGNVVFFLGGQINCSTTIHSCTDILRILSLNDEGVSQRAEELETGNSSRPGSGRLVIRPPSVKSPRSNFFKTFRRQKGNVPKVHVREEAGMEGELIDKIGKLDFRAQVEAFYTAYSKYLVLQASPSSTNLMIKYFSPGVIDMLCLNLPNGGIAPISNKDIFKVLSEYSLPSSVQKNLRATVMGSIRNGSAVSLELGLMTGVETKKSGFSIMGDRKVVRTEEKYVSHWTPLKDEEGRLSWVVLTMAPK